MKRILRNFVIIAIIVGVLVALPRANVVKAEQGYKCKSALLMDYDTGKVLRAQNETERLQIASMVKIMTLNLIFDEIEKGSLSTDDMISVSENASSMGGSQAFLDAGCSYQANELIKSIVVASANDSCVAMAEHIAGSVENFVAKMNDKASKLGMNDTYFVNCTGLPAPNQYCCAFDVAIMFRELISNERFFDYSKIWMFDFVHPSGRITQLTNTNKLVRFYEGCDGGKTGFTSEALSCLAATAKRGNTRFISVVIGAADAKTRNAQVSTMLNEAFSGYETKQYVYKQNLAGKSEVIGGKEKFVDCYPSEDYFVLTEKGENKAVDVQFEFWQVLAPIKKGDVVGKVIVLDGDTTKEIDLKADIDVEKKSFLDIVDDIVDNW